MTAILFAIVFMLLLGSFYFIALLYVRLSKLDGAEKKQQQLMEEMEDSLALYITEVKEENDRLIAQITRLQDKPPASGEGAAPADPIPAERSVSAELHALRAPKPPARKVLDSYKAQQTVRPAADPGEPAAGPDGEREAEETEFERVYRLNAEGLSADEIASRLGKGKTEIELILKFKR